MEKTIIQLQDINKIYRTKEGPFYAARSISLKIEVGEFMIIMGRSGCGKSTLLNILGFIDSFDEGTYWWNGKDTKKMDRNQCAKIRLSEIGYIYQSYNLIDELNCLENVELVMGYAGIKKSERKKRAQELLERVGLLDKAKSYPQELSGGQQQRIAIARAISNNPRVILADEPTGNLDYNTGMQVMEILKQLNDEGITIVMVTHDQELSDYASRIITMSDGEILQK